MTRPSGAQISELHILTTRDDAGRHFTEWAEHYEALEQMGLVVIHRPTHAATGLTYDCSRWSVEVTAEGLGYVETYPELGN